MVRAALHSSPTIVTACLAQADESDLPDDVFDAAVTRIDHHRDEIENAPGPMGPIAAECGPGCEGGCGCAKTPPAPLPMSGLRGCPLLGR